MNPPCWQRSQEIQDYGGKKQEVLGNRNYKSKIYHPLCQLQQEVSSRRSSVKSGLEHYTRDHMFPEILDTAAIWLNHHPRRSYLKMTWFWMHIHVETAQSFLIRKWGPEAQKFYTKSPATKGSTIQCPVKKQIWLQSFVKSNFCKFFCPRPTYT